MRILSDLDYCEQTGHGIPDVIEIYGKEAFEINENYVNVVLPFDKDVLKSNENKHTNKNVGVKLNKTQEIVYKLINENPYVTYLELASKINKSEETIRRNIKSLVNLNLIKRVGSDKTGHWEVNK